jgi:hypothetical protein
VGYETAPTKEPEGVVATETWFLLARPTNVGINYSKIATKTKVGERRKKKKDQSRRTFIGGTRALPSWLWGELSQQLFYFSPYIKLKRPVNTFKKRPVIFFRPLYREKRKKTIKIEGHNPYGQASINE